MLLIFLLFNILKCWVKGLLSHELPSEEIRSLALGPMKDALRFKSYIVHSFRFRTNAVDVRRKTLNSGVTLKAEQMSYSSRRDNPRSGDVTSYAECS